MPVIMGGREGGGGFTPKAGTVTHVVYVNAGDRPPSLARASCHIIGEKTQPSCLTNNDTYINNLNEQNGDRIHAKCELHRDRYIASRCVPQPSWFESLAKYHVHSM